LKAAGINVVSIIEVHKEKVEEAALRHHPDSRLYRWKKQVRNLSGTQFMYGRVMSSRCMTDWSPRAWRHSSRPSKECGNGKTERN
jgi:hypothetical protein